MTTIHALPKIEIMPLTSIRETRPTALLTGSTAWASVGSMFNLPLVVQAEPHNASRAFLDELADGLPEHVQVVYAVGGGLVCDVAKYIGYKRNLPVVVVPTVLSVDGFFTGIVATRDRGTVVYQDTGPATTVVIDWDVVRSAPAHFRGTGIAEILSMVTGLLDWRYAAERNRNTEQERYQPWAAQLAAGIAQQAFKIAKAVGEGRVDALRNLLDLICVEVQLTNQLGHNRPQEGSEQFFAYAIEPKVARERGVPFADLIGPGILLSAALHGQDVAPLRQTLFSAGIPLDKLETQDIITTLKALPSYVRQHNLPFTILNDTDITEQKAYDLLKTTGLGLSFHG
jgi:glycerol-1-phosphate dehydrogenase [NAD(P)+]